MIEKKTGGEEDRDGKLRAHGRRGGNSKIFRNKEKEKKKNRKKIEKKSAERKGYLSPLCFDSVDFQDYFAKRWTISFESRADE